MHQTRGGRNHRLHGPSAPLRPILDLSNGAALRGATSVLVKRNNQQAVSAGLKIAARQQGSACRRRVRVADIRLDPVVKVAEPRPAAAAAGVVRIVTAV